MRLIVTGFGPFHATEHNPSAQLAMNSARPNRILPVSWQAVDDWLESGEPEQFDVLLLLGYANRDRLTPELQAKNAYGGVPDVQNEVRKGEIEYGGPPTLTSSLWTIDLLANGLPSDHWRPSLDAGTYLCNYVSYRAMKMLPAKRIGFLHVPDFSVVAEVVQSQILASLIAAIEAE